MPFLTMLLILVMAGAGYAQSLADNLAAARKSLKARSWDEAILSSRAALTTDPGNQEAHLILSDAYEGAGKAELAVLSAIDAYDSPKRGLRTASNWTKQARKRIADQSPTLDAILAERAKAADELLKVRKSAEKAKRQYDVEWIEMMVFRLAPTETSVTDQTGRRGEQYWRLRGHGGSRPKLETGFVRLLAKPDDWVFIDEGPGSSKNEEEIVLNKHPKGYIPTVLLSKDELRTGARFVLRYSLKWTPSKELPAGKLPRLYCFFLRDPRPSSTDRAVSFTPTEVEAKVSFVVAGEDRMLRPLVEEFLDYKLVEPETWVDVEIRWAGKGSVLKVLVDDEVKLTCTPNEQDPHNMYIAFGFGNVEKGVIRNPRLNAIKPK